MVVSPPTVLVSEPAVVVVPVVLTLVSVPGPTLVLVGGGSLVTPCVAVPVPSLVASVTPGEDIDPVVPPVVPLPCVVPEPPTVVSLSLVVVSLPHAAIGAAHRPINTRAAPVPYSRIHDHAAMLARRGGARKPHDGHQSGVVRPGRLACGTGGERRRAAGTG